MSFYFIVFILICLLSLLSVLGNKPKKIAAIVIALVLILIAGLRMPGIDRDSLNYNTFFNQVEVPIAYFTKFSQYYFFEAGYYLVPAILKTVFHANVVWFFLFFAVLGITIKFKAIWALTEFQMLSILVYFCHFFIAHELTQIRQGVASGLLLLCVVQIKKKNLKKFISLTLVAIFFHYSALIFLPFYFLNPHQLNKKHFFIILFAPHLLYILKVNIITVLIALHLGIISEKLSVYNDLLDAGIFADINVYNYLFIIETFFCAFLIWKSDFFYTKNKYAILLIKIYTIALASWVLFSTIPVIAFRSYGYLGIVEIILVPFILYYIEEKSIAIAFTLIFALVSLFIDIVHNELVQPYESVVRTIKNNKLQNIHLS